ncbi:helix-turn-helix domain-containing protein [Clostridium perfringens]
MTIGDKIKIYRKNLGLNQAELAEMVGLSPSAIRMYETNKREPKMDTLQKICTALNIPVTELFIDEFEEKFPSEQLNREAKAFEGIDNIAKYFNIPINFHSMSEEDAYDLLNNIGSYIEFLIYKNSKN